MRETIKINCRQLPVFLRKFHENSMRLWQLLVIKKTQKFLKIGKIDKKLLKSSKNCYTGNIFKAAEKRAAKGFDRACRKRLFGLCGGRGARLAFGGAFAHINLFADPVWSRYLCGVMFAALRVTVPLRYGFVCCYDIRSCSRSRSVVTAVMASCLWLCVLLRAYVCILRVILILRRWGWPLLRLYVFAFEVSCGKRF